MANKGRFSGTAFDSLLMLNDGSATMSATGTSEGVEVNETPAHGATAKIIVPGDQDGGTLVVEVQAADTDLDANYVTVAQSESIAAVGEYDVRFSTQRKYVREKHTVTGTNPGKVSIGVVTHGF